jgi:thiamine-monophosphate kinase
MRVSEAGEFELIRLLTSAAGIPYPPLRDAVAPEGLLVPLGDDAVVTSRRDGAVVWTTDTMVENVHFLPGRTAWQDVGWKALAVNLSDVAAMGATPHLALVTLALPPEFEVEDAQALYRGLAEAASVYGVTLGGGDIVRAPVFSVTVALSGWAATGGDGEPVVMTRSAARNGDVVAVTGTLGDSAAGLQLIRDDDAIDTPAKRCLRLRHERPAPRLEMGAAAVRAGVRCAIDVSDGLVQDLGHIATASAVAIRADILRLPLGDELCEVYPGRAAGFALRGGEDYELVLIGKRAVIESLVGATDTPIMLIGEVVSDETVHVGVVDESGREIPLGRGGWDHFGR